MDTFADRVARQWAGIERAMNFANRNSAFRPQVESLINIYFDLIDDVLPRCGATDPGEGTACWPGPESTANINTKTVGNLYANAHRRLYEP